MAKTQTINTQTIMGVVIDKQPNPEELVKKIPVPNSPFTAIVMEDKCFGTFGKYKITKDYDNLQSVLDEFKEITWDKIVIVISLINEMMKQTINSEKE